LNVYADYMCDGDFNKYKKIKNDLEEIVFNKFSAKQDKETK